MLYNDDSPYNYACLTELTFDKPKYNHIIKEPSQSAHFIHTLVVFARWCFESTNIMDLG